MGKSIIDRIQDKLELLRLEKRYTRSRHRRSAFVSNAVYVDGEYVYQVPNSTGSSSSSKSDSSASASEVPRVSALHGEKATRGPAIAQIPIAEETSSSGDEASYGNSSAFATADRKRMNRFSSIPGFGNGFGSKQTPRVSERRLSMIR